MATKKKTQPSNLAQAPAAKPGLRAFSLLVSGANVADQVDKRMAKGALEAPSEDIERAWAQIASPAGVVLMTLNEDHNAFVSHRYFNDAEPAVLAPGYSAAALEIISAGLEKLSDEIERVAASEPFRSAASDFAPMLANPAPKEALSYPLLSSAIRPALSTIDGEKLPTLSGAPIVSISIERNHGAPSLLINSIRHAAEKEIAQSPEAQEMLKSAERQLTALKAHMDHANARDHGAPSSFSHVTAATLGRASFLGEVPLPSVAGMRQMLAEIKKSAGLELFDSSRHRSYATNQREVIERDMKQAVQMTRRAALTALSCALAPSEGAFSLATRETAWHALSSPLSPVALALKKGNEALEKHLRAGEALYSAIVDTRPDDADIQADQRNMFKWLERNKDNAPVVDRALLRAYELGSKRIDENDRQRRAHYNRYDYNDRRTLLDPIKVGKAPGFKGVQETLAQTHPRIGLAQWGVSALRSIEKAEHLNQGKHQQDPARSQLLASLSRFKNALRNASFAFADKALEEAEKTELAWLDEREFGDAWRQAASMGLPSQRSIAWAKQNPMGASLSSSDPIARMAGQTARALGIRADEDATMAEALRSELAELGLSEEGFSLLKESQNLRAFMTPVISGLVGAAKPLVRVNTLILPIICKAVSSAARLGMPGDEAALFAKALVQTADGEHSSPGSSSALGNSINAVRAVGGEGARLFVDLAKARAERQGSLFDALGRDWLAARSIAKDLGVNEQESLSALMTRLNQFACRVPNALNVDWRQDAFKDKQAWEIFEGESPRLRPVLSAAKAQGGLAARCAEWADEFHIKDAADANDLIGRCKQHIKTMFSLSEGSWKAVIKSEEALDLLNERIVNQYHGYYRQADRIAMKKEFLLSDEELAKMSHGRSHYHNDTSAQRVGLGMNLATSQNVPLSSALAAISVFEGRRNSTALFSGGIDERDIDSVEAAEFYIQEERAKADRTPKIFKEACKRFEKLDADRAQALARKDPEPPLAGKEALSAEVADLTDWMVNSEYGVWQTLPKDPTWGQLSRLSRAWHDEMAARELDRIAREKAKQKEEAMVNRLNPFAPRASEHWEPILGKHARDGWEAVELTSQAQLSEEGTAMSHCVSSYSGYCREGMLRIFSIRLNGERKCTMELRPKGQGRLCDTKEKAGFSITQNKGRHNAAVTNQATQKFCEETLAAAEQSWAAKWRETQALIAEFKEKERLKQEKEKAAKKEAKSAAPKA